MKEKWVTTDNYKWSMCGATNTPWLRNYIIQTWGKTLLLFVRLLAGFSKIYTTVFMKLIRKVGYKAKEAPLSFWCGSRNFKSISWGIFLHYCQFLKIYCINLIEYVFPLPMNIIPWPASSGVGICLQFVSFSMLIGLRDIAAFQHFARVLLFQLEQVKQMMKNVLLLLRLFSFLHWFFMSSHGK